MPHIALMDTSTASKLVSDSAAGMTAIVTGERTHPGVVAQSASAVRGQVDGVPLKTILEHAEERGLATGIISNDSLAGATPATLYAKSNDRGNRAAIFLQAFAPRFGDGVDVMIGSGRAEIEQALAATGRSIASVARDHGRPILASMDQIPAGPAFVLMDDEEFDVGRAVRMAVDILSRAGKGYFLMVESDAHTDAIRKGLDRMVTLDRVIQQTASNVGDDTLVLFTADHSFDLRVYAGAWGTPPLLEGGRDGRQGGLRAARARPDGWRSHRRRGPGGGPRAGAERVPGYMANTDLFHVMMQAFGCPVR